MTFVLSKDVMAMSIVVAALLLFALQFMVKLEGSRLWGAFVLVYMAYFLFVTWKR